VLLSAAGAGDEGVVSMASARAVVKEEKQETRCAPAVRAKSEVAGRLALSKEAMSVVSMECGERRREAKKGNWWTRMADVMSPSGGVFARGNRGVRGDGIGGLCD